MHLYMPIESLLLSLYITIIYYEIVARCRDGDSIIIQRVLKLENVDLVCSGTWYIFVTENFLLDGFHILYYALPCTRIIHS